MCHMRSLFIKTDSDSDATLLILMFVCYSYPDVALIIQGSVVQDLSPEENINIHKNLITGIVSREQKLLIILCKYLVSSDL